MNMVKEGIQTRRRRQKNSNSTATVGKLKSNKTTSTVLTPLMKEIKPASINARDGTYPYGESYSGPYPRFFSNSRATTNHNVNPTSSLDPELLARQIMQAPAPTNNPPDHPSNDEQR